MIPRIKRNCSKIILIIFFVELLSSKYYSQIKVHPSNPHYFEFRNKPTVLVASGEHYGAVINLDFNYEIYLETLKDIGLNHTRIFLGDYVEEKDAFCIENNTLSPNQNKIITPWKRSKINGYELGGNKFDLDKWNDDYFLRLDDFMTKSQSNDIIVEVVLFFHGYLFKNSPFYFKNNINNTDSISERQYMTLENGNILERQKLYVKKMVKELNKYDNLIFNVANEPWFNNQIHPGFVSTPSENTKKWIKKVTEWIVETEKKLPQKHLISVDYTNEGQIIPNTDIEGYYKNISVFNHHYDKNAKSATLNYSKNLILSFNETGLMPASTPEYRIQGWKYLFSGGALYNNLDFSYQVGSEDGSGSTYFSCNSYSGCTDKNIKYQLANLLKFIKKINFVEMKPDFNSVILKYGDENIYPMIWKENQYAIYFEGGSKAKIKLIIPSGLWKLCWINPSDLVEIDKKIISVENNEIILFGPKYQEDILLFIEK